MFLASHNSYCVSRIAYRVKENRIQKLNQHMVYNEEEKIKRKSRKSEEGAYYIKK